MRESLRRAATTMASNRLAVCALAGLSFLWPFYQRAFFRVTLFYQLSDLAESCYSVFLVLFLAGALALGIPPVYRKVESHLAQHRSDALIASLLSVIATLYLSGAVAPTAGGPIQAVFAVIATAGYAVATLAVSALWLLIIMRIVYEKGLFNAVAVLVASGMIGCLLSPTFSTSLLSTGLVPVFGVLVSGLCAWLAYAPAANETDALSYQPLSNAPYIKTWLIPLVSYLLFSFLHAFAFASDASIEVHVSNGELAAASSSVSDYAVYFVFSALLLAASINSWSTKHSDQDKATFWVALMGVSVGLFLGLLFADALSGADPSASIALSTTTRCFTVLLAVVVLFLTYQNRLSPLQSFGICFFAVYVAEKVLAYLIFPAIFAVFGAMPDSMARAANTLLLGTSSAVMLLFLVKLCRSNALRLLFSVNDQLQGAERESHARDARVDACESIALKFELTRRELDILRYLAVGHSAKRIGEILCISERTVQTHTQNMYRKLGVHNRQMVIDLVEEYSPDLHDRASKP